MNHEPEDLREAIDFALWRGTKLPSSCKGNSTLSALSKLVIVGAHKNVK